MNAVWVLVMFAVNGAVVISNPTDNVYECQTRAAIMVQEDKKRDNMIKKAECYQISYVNVGEKNFLMSLRPEGFDKNDRLP